jgi:hypothetical protein
VPQREDFPLSAAFFFVQCSTKQPEDFMSANTYRIISLGVSLLVSCKGWPQVLQEHKQVVVNGHTGDIPIVQFDGRTYVDLESFVRTANGSVVFKQNQIILSLPGPKDTSLATNDSEHTLSRPFMKAGIEEIGLLRDWATPLTSAIQNGYPISDEWISAYRNKAEDGLRVASVSASSDADRKALQLLTNEFEAVRQWSTNLVDARKSLSTGNYATSNDALRNDPLSQKILSCAHFLGPMLTSGTFQDDASCH